MRVVVENASLAYTEDPESVAVPPSTMEHFNMIKSISHVVEMLINAPTPAVQCDSRSGLTIHRMQRVY